MVSLSTDYIDLHLIILAGWKRVDVEEKWFLKRSKACVDPSKFVLARAERSSSFVSPYPSTYYCDVPRPGRDVIQNDLCRPLPTQNFPPPPPPAPAPVVGTPEWQEWKERQNTVKQIRVWTRDGAGPVTITPPQACTLL